MSNFQSKRSTDSSTWGSAVIGIVVAAIGISLFSDGSPWQLVLVTVGGLCLAASAAWAGIRERNTTSWPQCGRSWLRWRWRAYILPPPERCPN